MPRLDHVLLACSGLLNQRPVSAHMLEQTLCYAFRVRVHIQSFVGRWKNLYTEQTTSLGPTGQNCVLGQNAVAGEHIWDQSAAISIQIYPENLQQLKQFLPGSPHCRQLSDLMQYLLGDFTARHVEMHLPAKQIPNSRLSRDAADAPRLSWSSWLPSPTSNKDGCISFPLRR